jgi:ribose transport system substrate-binding protein
MLVCVLLAVASIAFATGNQEVTNVAGDTGNSGKTLVFIPKTTSSQFWVNIYKGTKEAAKELGYKEVKFQGASSGADVTGQINIFNDVVTSHPDGIMIAVTDQIALKKPIEDAIAAGIPVITVNSGIDSKMVLAHVATDNYMAGSMAADALAESIGKKGTVIDIGVDPSSETGRMRENGFRDRMTSAYPAVKVLPVQFACGDVAKAMNITSDLLTGNPDVVGIYAAQDAGGTGAAQVLKQRNMKSQVKLVSFDSSPDEFAIFLEGNLDAMVVQDPYNQGFKGVYALDEVIKGKITEQIFIETPVKILNIDNISELSNYNLLASDANIKKMMDKAGITAK